MATKIIDINGNAQSISGASGAYTFYLEAWLNSQDPATRKSNITVYHYAKGNNDWAYSGFNTPTSVIKVQDITKKTTTVGAIGGSKVQIGTWTGDVQHNPDGTLSLKVEAVYNSNQSAYTYLPKANTQSKTVSVQTIQTATTISAPASATITTSGNLAVTVTAQSSSFYNKLVGTIGGSSWNILNMQQVAGTQTVNIPFSDIYSRLTSDMTGTLTLTMSTWVDGATQVGNDQVATCNITLQDSSFKPTAAITATSVNSGGLNGRAIAGKSILQMNWSASGAAGTTTRTSNFLISSNKPTITPTMDTTTRTSSGTGTATGTALSKTLPESVTDYTVKFTHTVTDGRQQSSSVDSGDITVYGYKKPSAQLLAYRVANSGSTQADGTGTWLYIAFDGSLGASIDGQNSLGTMTCTYAGSISGSVPVADKAGKWIRLDYTESVTVTLTVPDQVDQTVLPLYVAPASFPLDLYDNGSGTTGVGLGAPAEPGVAKNGLAPKGFWCFGACSTAAATTAKTVTVSPGFNLHTGVMVFVHFTNANSASNPTLNVNGTGAKDIYRYGTTRASTSAASSWQANSVQCLVYDGSVWRLCGWLNSTYSEISTTNISNVTTSSTGLISGRRFKLGFDTNLAQHTGTYVYNGAATDTITFTDANMAGKSYIICGTQDAGNPVNRASLNGSTGEITVYLSSAVTLMRVNYICF